MSNDSDYCTEICRQTFRYRGRIFTPEEILDGQLESCLAEDSQRPDQWSELDAFLRDWFSASPCMKVQTSGSTGTPKQMLVEKRRMICSAVATCRFFHLHEGQTALLCMNLKYIGAKMMVVRALAANLELVLCPTLSGRPLHWLQQDIDLAAMVPLQLYDTLQQDAEQLGRVRILLIGGSAVEEDLVQQIQDLPTAIYSTYGMTETLSHIALRKLNGPHRSQYYTPLEGISLSGDSDGRLVISAPQLTASPLLTNDLVTFRADGSFRVEGRADNVIVSGGIKLQIEKLEEKLAGHLTYPYAITFVRDAKFGQKVVLLIEEPPTQSIPEKELEEIWKQINQSFEKYERPKALLLTKHIPLTENCKRQRRACQELAEQDKKRMFVKEK